MQFSQYENIDPPEKHELPEGLEMFNQLPHNVADELFADEWCDLDREWVMTVAAHCLRPNPDECEIGRMVRTKVLDLATNAGDSQYAKDTYLDEMGAL